MERRKSFPVKELRSLDSCAWELDRVSYWRKVSSPTRLGQKVKDLGYNLNPKVKDPGYSLNPKVNDPGYKLNPKVNDPGYNLNPEVNDPVYKLNPKVNHPEYKECLKDNDPKPGCKLNPKVKEPEYKLNLKVNDPNEVFLCANDLYTGDLEPEEQFLHYDETVISSVNPCLEQQLPKLEKSSVLDEESGVHSDSQHSETGVMETEIENFDKYSDVTSDPILDNCCSLDIVTIRNESVLAKTDFSNKLRLGSDGYETASSTEMSSIEEGPLFKNENRLFTACDEFFLPGEFFIERPSLISEGNHRISQRSQSTCPNCGEVIRLPNFKTSAIPIDNIWQDQMVKDEITKSPTFVSTFDDEDDIKETANTSPYYVRLRRNLHIPGSTIQIDPPKNFSVDPQGQLHIDYTANWEGLEEYIENLKR